ncbi:putative WRKY transcription factor 19 [Phytophthora citrophthora]|uniref:WRKY transcription factor 19 n=1 Tax=Phytophthora citrophthora TaxID=4793 RepID=A0AAD9GNN4_9STRA|nr:putative WRKY transcription factor 19 [Phytophthora citrophthora]
MVTCAQHNDNYRNLHSLKVTATILTHLATHTIPTIPGRRELKPTRLPGIRSLFMENEAQVVAAVLPPLQCAVGLINLGSPLSTENQSLATTPTKALVAGSPISPNMIPSSPLFESESSSTTYQTISPKPRRPLSLHDLLSTETPTSPTQHCKNVHHRRQCGIADCHKYALTGGYCIRHGGGKRCNFDGCQTVAQSGGRCKAHGGGSKCKVSGCGSVARRKGFCMMHGGRQQCKIDGCTKCAHGGGFCISHGGGKRCSSIACNKSAQAGGFCYSHGGGKRCAAPECFQAARKGGLCIRHRKAATVLHCV